jgi:hypothetical protein
MASCASTAVALAHPTFHPACTARWQDLWSQEKPRAMPGSRSSRRGRHRSREPATSQVSLGPFPIRHDRVQLRLRGGEIAPEPSEIPKRPTGSTWTACLYYPTRSASHAGSRCDDRANPFGESGDDLEDHQQLVRCPTGGATMLKIWGRDNSVNVQKALWCCEEMGVQYQRIDAGGTFGIVNTQQYRALNPNGRVPTIDDDGFILSESTIVRYPRQTQPREALARGSQSARGGGGWTGPIPRSGRRFARCSGI